MKQIYEHGEHGIIDDKMRKYLKKLENEFIITKELRIFICTWNMNAEKPDKMKNDFNIMWDFKGKEGDNPIPDVVVIGF